MHDQIVNDGARRHDEPPAEMQMIILRAGTPAAARIAYFDASGNEFEGLAEIIDPLPNVSLCAFLIPVNEKLPSP